MYMDPSAYLMANSLPPAGAPAVNPAVNTQTDAASRMMLEQAQQLEAPQAPQPQASALQQFFSLLGANSGANLLRNPAAAEGATNAVANEMKKPQLNHLEELKNRAEARQLRLQSMIRLADQAAKKAEAEGDAAKALNLKKQVHQWSMEEDAANNAVKVHIAEIAAGSRENVAATRASAVGKKAGGQSAGGNRAELAARYRSALAKAHGAIDKEALAKGWTKEYIKAAKGFQTQRLAAEYNAALKGEPRPNAPPFPAEFAPPAGGAPGQAPRKLSDTPGISAADKAALIKAGK